MIRLDPAKRLLIGSLITIILLCSMLVVYRFSWAHPAPLGIDQDAILNYLAYNLNHSSQIGLTNLAWTLDSYDILNVSIPNRSNIIQYLNSQQNDQGTWDYGGLYSTSNLLMFYNRSGAKPLKPLDPFFSTVDTWSKVVLMANEYASENFWGYLYLIVNMYCVNRGSAPPWEQEFLNEANASFDSWAYSNHQRTHLILNLYQLRKPVPRVDDVVTIALQQQNANGSWENSEAETVFMAGALELLKNQTGINQTYIDSAVNRGFNFVLGCYRTIEYEGNTYAGFVDNPSQQNPSQRETALGIYATLNPESDVWTRWFSADALYRFTVSLDNSNHTIVSASNSTLTSFSFSYSLKRISYTISSLQATVGYCNTSIPKSFMWSDSPSQWSLTVNGLPLENHAITQNSTHTFLYFTYSEPLLEASIVGKYVVPELTTTPILLLFMGAVSLSIVLTKKRARHNGH